MGLKFSINNIVRCLVIVVILSPMRKYHQFNTLIKCSTFLQVDYLHNSQQASVTQSTLQAQPIYIYHRVSLHKHTIHPYNLH